MNSKSATKAIENLQTIGEDTAPEAGYQDDFAKKKNSWESMDFQPDVFLTYHWNRTKNLVKNNRNPRTLATLGDIQFIKKNFPGAKKYYSQAINLDRNLLSLYQKLIFIFLSEKSLDKADEYHKKLLHVTDWRSDFLHNYVLFRTTFYDSREENERLLRICEKGIKNDPSNYSLINTLGFIYLKLEKLDLAEEQFRKTLSISSNFPHSLNNLGVIYLKRKEVDEAITYYQLAVKSDPKYTIAYENLAQCYLLMNRPEKCIRILDAASENGLELSYEWKHQKAWLYIQVSEYQKAIEWYEKQIGLEPDNNFLYNNLGYCLFKTGNISEGEKYLNKSVKIFSRKNTKGYPIDPRSFLAFYNLGRIAIQKSDSDKILELVEKITAFNKDDAFADYLMGAESMLKKDYAAAKKFYIKALKKTPNIPELYIDLSFIYESIENNYTEAIQLLELSIKRGGSGFLTFNNLAYAYIENGEIEKAEKILNSFEESVSPLILTNKGIIAFRKGYYRRGESYFKKAVPKFDGDLKVVAEQYWLLEKIQYYVRKNKLAEAKELFTNLVELKGTYLDQKIESLGKKLKIKV